MAELGRRSDEYHRGIGELARGLEVEVIGVGERAHAYDPVAWAADADDAVEVARSLLRPATLCS